jgi:tRNA G18 (ribose-2'-O)-methylase SpoU
VPNLIPLADPEDPRLADFAGMRDQTLRLAVEQPLGAFVGEGALVLERALRYGFTVRAVLAEPAHLPQVEPVMAGRPEPVYVMEREVMRLVTGYREHPGPLSSYLRKPELSVEAVLATAHRVVLLEDVANPTNMGVVFRCAAGLGMDAVVITPNCADPLYRRSVRASMGEAFAIPWARLDAWPSGLGLVQSLGFTVAALTPAPDALPLQDFAANVPDRLALLFGAEGPGLSAQAMAQADVRVSIPMDRGVDSLNIGTSAAIAFYAVRGS